jgi:RND family efflux transporter MFP subunit
MGDPLRSVRVVSGGGAGLGAAPVAGQSHQHSWRRRRWRWAAAAVAALVLAIAAAAVWRSAVAPRGGLAGWRSVEQAAYGGASEASGPLLSAQWQSVDTTVTATGVIRPRVGGEVRIGSQVSGVVKSLRVTEGSHIRKGEAIAVIDSRAVEARLGQARAQVAVDQVELRRAGVELARVRRLAAAGVLPRQQEEDLTLAEESAQAKLERSRRDVAAVETDLANVVLRAPISGTIASVTTQEGETVAASFAAPTFVTILADDALQLVAVVDETDIGNIRSGNPVRFTTEAFPARELGGRVARVAPKATIVSGVVNYEVTVEIDPGAGGLKPDMTANVTIQTARHAALMLPSSSLRHEGEGYLVLVENGGRLEKRRVTVGVRQAGMSEIKSGLRAGERVAAEPAAARDKE